jgi:hypothetical protein
LLAELIADFELAACVWVTGWRTPENVAVAVGLEAAFDFRQFGVVKHPLPDVEVELLLVFARRKLNGETHCEEN